MTGSNPPLAPPQTAGEGKLDLRMTGFDRLLETLARREAALAESESRSRAIADNASALIWLAGTDKLCNYFNSVWLEFTGRSVEQELGNGWAEGVHPDDLERCLATYVGAFDARREFTMEYRLRRHDGEYRWLTDHGVPRHDDRGVFLGYIGSCIDITDRMRAEQYEQFRGQVLELQAQGKPLSGSLESIALGVQRLNPGLVCCILLLDGKRLRVGAAPGLPDLCKASAEGVELGPAAGSSSTAASTGRRVIVEDMDLHPGAALLRGVALRTGLRASWSEPIRSSSGQVLGVFTVQQAVPRAPSETELGVLEQAARLAGTVIERSVAAERLRESEERFRTLMENISGVAVQGYALDGTVTFWNRASEQLYGYTAHDALGGKLLDLIIPPEIREGVAGAMQQMRDTGQAIPAGELTLRRKDGSAVPVFSSHAIVHPIGRAPELFCLDIDLTERKQAEAKLHLAASVFTHAREGIVITDADANIVDVNDTFSRITGYSRDEVLGRNPRILGSGRHEPEFFAAMWRHLAEHGHWTGEIWNRRKNGEVYAETKTISAVRDAQGTTRQYVALFSDITPIKDHERQLEHIAHYDALTALPNRVLLADRLHQAMAQTLRRKERLAVAYLDLDGFKAVNDRHGHEAGDQLLMTLAASMKQALREGDTLARLGGDEFVAVLLDLADAEASVPILGRLLSAAAQPVQAGGLALQVSASVGVTFYPQADEVDADQLLRQADQAMYQAKLAGKNRYHVFDAEQDRSVRGHYESLDRIRRALAEREFELHYQPKVNLRTGAVIGAEALIRWRHPDKGLLPPAVFLPVIEDHPLAVDVGEWVIAAALAQIEQWHAAGLRVPVSVNLGARQLQQADFVERLRALLAAHPGVAAGDLELEVLETSALEDLGRASRVIEACRQIGVTFALDDFGTGYSSLSYLKRLPVRQIKIDRSFVGEMLDDPDDLAILEGVLRLSAAFRREVIAEGVETVEHGSMLLQLGCELAQGYGIARPMPAAAWASWTAAWQPDPAWADLQPVGRAGLPLLFAAVEHRAWVAAVASHLMGERAAPALPDEHGCQFGAWLDGDGLAHPGAGAALRACVPLHRDLHQLATDLHELRAAGLGPQAQARVGEFHRLADALLGQIEALARASR